MPSHTLCEAGEVAPKVRFVNCHPTPRAAFRWQECRCRIVMGATLKVKFRTVQGKVFDIEFDEDTKVRLHSLCESKQAASSLLSSSVGSLDHLAS